MNFQMVSCHLIRILSPWCHQREFCCHTLGLPFNHQCRSVCTGLQTSCNINPQIQAFVFGNGCCAIQCSCDMIGLIALKISEAAFPVPPLPPKLLVQTAVHPTAAVGGPWCKLYFPLTSLALPPFLQLTQNRS